MRKRMIIGSLCIAGVFLTSQIDTLAAEKDSSSANFNVETGERALMFTDDEPVVNFGNIKLGGGKIQTKNAKLPEIQVKDDTGSKSGYDVYMVLEQFKDSSGKELESPTVNITTKGNESNTTYGGTVYGVAEKSPVLDTATKIYTADKDNGMGTHILKEDKQDLELSLETSELRANQTYTATATIAFNPSILVSPHIENPIPVKVGNEWVAKIRNAYVDEDGNKATDVYVKLEEDYDGYYTIIDSGITEEANNNVEILYGDLKIPSEIGGKPVKEIGRIAFSNSKFTGKFIAPNLEIVGSGAFNDSTFTGDFNAPKMTKIVMTAFQKSKFTGDFNAPNLTEVGSWAFRYSEFAGKFNAPKLTEVGKSSFGTSKFIGEFQAPGLTKVEQSAFENSLFTGEFIAPNLSVVEERAFAASKFSGDFNAPKLTELGGQAFQYSEFTGDFKAPKIKVIGDGKYLLPGYTFENSKFKGHFEAPMVEKVYIGNFKNSNFKSANIPKDAEIESDNGNLKEFQ